MAGLDICSEQLIQEEALAYLDEVLGVELKMDARVHS